jgi:hypothetical protein
VKPFSFPLDKVLRFKERNEWLAQAKQEQANAVLQARLAEVAALHDQLLAACNERPAKVGEPLDTAAWLVGYWQSVRLGQALDVAEERVRQAAMDYQQAANLRQQAAKEVEVLLTLRRQQHSAHRNQLQRVRQEELEEISLRTWLVGRSDDRHQGRM